MTKRPELLYICLFVVSFVAISSFLPLHTFAAEKTPLLKSTISIDDSLTAMPDALSPGKIFNGLVKGSGIASGSHELAEESNGLWYQVPEWLSGYWKLSSKESATFTDLTTGKTSTVSSELDRPHYNRFGRIKDEQGVIWDRAPLKQWRKYPYNDSTTEFRMSHSGQTELKDENNFQIKSVDFEVTVETKSQKILSASQGELVYTYSNNPDSSNSVHVISRHYDRQGNAKSDRVIDHPMQRMGYFDSAKEDLQDRKAFLHWRNAGASKMHSE